MACLRNLLGYGLTAVVVGGAGSLWMQPSAWHSNVLNGNTSHRGSGRIVTQESGAQGAIAYRGTGRAPHEVSVWTISHRGSGRTPVSGDTAVIVSYRGTGRISSALPQPFAV